MDWNDTLGIARCLNQNPDLEDLDLFELAPEFLETLIIENGYAADRMPHGMLRTNSLNSVLWHWMRLRDEDDQDMREAG